MADRMFSESQPPVIVSSAASTETRTSLEKEMVKMAGRFFAA
jgi:hypothetical protein